jgi:LPXTG-motif cell wall-anchored protein
MRRVFTVVATAGVAVAGLAGPSAAATLPLCSPNDGYIPGTTCEVAVTATVECVNGTPVLDYAVASGAVAGASTVDIRWTNLPGADLVLADQPLTVQNQPWPAAADAAVTLVFGTSPAETRVNVSAPVDCAASLVLSAPETTGGSGVAAAAANQVRSQSASGVLAATGSDALPLALGGGGLILGGAALVLARRTRRIGS